MQDAGRIYSYDLHESKLPLITDGAERLGLSSITVGERDAREPDPALVGMIDAVHCDVPCSGLGVLAKKPDLRYRFEERGELPPLQLEILTATAAYLKPGGRLLYSTCTVNPAENEGVFEKFLAENPQFQACPFEIADLSAPTGVLTLYPHRHGCDGFFYALARKKTPSES
jgi:16S rRNA (cytosine967-C5)-methyltransferase